MNQFTKKELEEIYYRLENSPQALEDKLKSMIDNYCECECECEHINHPQEIIKQKICCGTLWSYTYAAWSVAKCSLCGKNFDDNK